MANVEHNFLNDKRFFTLDGKVFSSDFMMNNDDTLAFLNEEIHHKLEKLLKENPMYNDCLLQNKSADLCSIFVQSPALFLVP